MTSTVEAVVSSVRAIQGALLVIAGLQLTGYMYPQSTTVTNGASYDFIICGAGTGGSVIANRLTEIPNINVLLIEAGDDPRIESLLPGLLTLQPLTEQDFNFTSEDDGRTGQYLKDRVVGMSQGKMLGGSSSLNHLIHARGNARDYQRWADAAQDESWNFDNLMQYFIKSEKVEDEDILKSKLGKYHGTEGYLRVSTQRSDENIPIFEAFAELDHENVLTANTPEFTVGITEPLLNIADGKRQSTAEYLRPLSDRPNFHIMKNTHVTKVLFDDDRNAIGVEAVTAGGETVTINANVEVILAAGAFVTPQLLMLSGVGPKDHLESFNIDVISDLPVGKNLQDHVDPVVIHALQEGEAPTAPANPHEYPVPTTVAYTALDMNQGYPDYQTINLLFPPDSTGLIQFCSLVFAYNDEICQKWFDGGKGRYTLFTCHNLMQPYSTGEVLLRSADPKDPPIIHHGIFSNETDLHNMALYLKDFARFGKTSYMKNVGGFLIDLELEECKGLSKDSYEYWRCYALSMSATLWHYSSTASMGPVLDSHLRVKGVNRLRVADSSAMPNTVSGNPMAAVVALAEKAADLIKKDNGASPRSSN